ncbi:MAG TPA: class GN sortase, partial [Candidatus Saccharimonadia bacterium]|nr:class GN sortase [Candidatus Saccharimonadia bacterium]
MSAPVARPVHGPERTADLTAREAAMRLQRRLAAWQARLQRLFSGRRIALAASSLLAAYGLGGAGYVHAKAQLAQVLVRHAWERSVARSAIVKPWPWADTWPVAVLEVPRLGLRQFVLAGASGRTLAFGPALSTAARRPGEPGRVVVSGHRDTHFAFLRNLRVGDRVWLSDARGRYAYEIVAFEVADSRTSSLSIATDDARLALVTCYPFDALTPGGPLRYVVEARLVATAQA